MDGVASAAMSSDKVALGFDDGADEKGRHRRTAFWRGKSVTVAFFSDKVRWWECEGGSYGAGETMSRCRDVAHGVNGRRALGGATRGAAIRLRRWATAPMLPARHRTPTFGGVHTNTTFNHTHDVEDMISTRFTMSVGRVGCMHPLHDCSLVRASAAHERARIPLPRRPELALQSSEGARAAAFPCPLPLSLPTASRQACAVPRRPPPDPFSRLALIASACARQRPGNVSAEVRLGPLQTRGRPIISSMSACPCARLIS